MASNRPEHSIRQPEGHDPAGSCPLPVRTMGHVQKSRGVNRWNVTVVTLRRPAGYEGQAADADPDPPDFQV